MTKEWACRNRETKKRSKVTQKEDIQKQRTDRIVETATCQFERKIRSIDRPNQPKGSPGPARNKWFKCQ